MGIRLSREEAWAELERAHTGVLTTLRGDGAPVALPVWFVALDEHVYVGTPERTRKVARIRRDPRVSFLVASGERWAELRGVHLSGRARLVTDPVERARVEAALDAKYAAYRTPRAAMPDATRRYYDVPAAIVEIVPDERILTWDNARLPLDG